MAKKKTYESDIKRLQEITEKIEQGDMDLDKTVALFEEGTELAKECHEFLNKTELKINKLINDHGEQTEDFNPE
jgi:exodeoxyribonuclease VII small subunit